MADNPVPTICRCKVQSARITSWTDGHPGRRFERCRFFGTRRACGHWTWIDPEMCKRSKEIIPGLLRKINGYEARTKDLEEENARLRAENMNLRNMAIGPSGGISGEEVKNEIDELSARLEELHLQVGI